MKTGIFGGTFNPIHCGHLINCEFVRSSAGLDRVIFVPAGTPVHKPDLNIESAEDRCNMISLAIENNPDFSLSRIEIERSTESYTIYTLDAFRKTYPEDELFLIIGSDSFNELDTWKDYEKIIRSVSLIVMTRPGDVSLRKDLLEAADQYVITKNPLIELSSSEIREQVRRGISVRYQLPDSVNNYILSKGLYKH